ncbi:MAG: 5-formyltetrahydrofolate cyclo-ligase [Deltaproteobacteria bacterium]|nr:MAG: 5-formyltetrahydrofolate cyclo-ligase [Deltaproteobacteria bacterium]
MGKVSIRKQFLDCRKKIAVAEYARLSQQVQQQLIASDCFVRAESLALYSPIHNEVVTEQIFAAARKVNKKVYYPRVAGDEFAFFEVATLEELVTGAFGVAEPVSAAKISVADLDLVVVPGVAFDLHGYRLGYGRGFYDRQLVGKPTGTVSVGLCFNLQLYDSLPVETHDQAMDFIATETRFIPCHI